MKKYIATLIPLLFLAYAGTLLVQQAQQPQEIRQRAQSASGVNLYVTTNGNDNNNGSQAAPFKTIQKAINAAGAGTTIHVGPGLYNERVRITKDGNANGWIKLLSDTKHGAHIASSPSEQGYTVSVQADYIHIEGFEITGGRIALDAVSNNFVVKGNKIHNAHKMQATSNGGAGIEVYTNDYGPLSNVTIDGNIVYDIGLSIGGSQTTQGIYISVPCAGCKVINNLVYQVEDFGIHAYHNPQNWIVANNTVFNNGRGILVGPGFTVNNNISFNNKGNGYQIASADAGGAPTFANNLSFGNGNNNVRTGVIAADPQFVSYQPNGSGDYHLRPTSPGFDKGTTNSAPNTDIEGKSRPQGAGVDIGAFETGGSNIPPSLVPPTLITPTVYCVGGTGGEPCATIPPTISVQPSVSGGANITLPPVGGTNPTVGASNPSPSVNPCTSDTASSVMHDKGKGHKKVSGGLIDVFMRFIIEFLRFLLEMLGIQIPTNPNPGGNPNPTQTPSGTPNPTQNPGGNPTQPPAASPTPCPEPTTIPVPTSSIPPSSAPTPTAIV